MPSEEDVKAETGQGSVGNVTQPFVTETYRCVAPYETKDTKNKAFKVAADEKVDVLIKDKAGEPHSGPGRAAERKKDKGERSFTCVDPAGWWLVENEAKRMAWFPAPYLEKLEEDDDEDEIDGTPERGCC